MSKHNEKPTSFYHHKDRKNRSRSRSHSYIKDKKNHSKSSISPIKHKSNEYYIEKYRALYQTNGGSLKEKHKHEKINPLKKEEKDESIIFFRKKYGGEIRNLHTKHSDVFRVVKKEAKVGKKLEIKQKKEENAGKNYKEIKSNYISHKTLKNSKISENNPKKGPE